MKRELPPAQPPRTVASRIWKTPYFDLIVNAWRPRAINAALELTRPKWRSIVRKYWPTPDPSGGDGDAGPDQMGCPIGTVAQPAQRGGIEAGFAGQTGPEKHAI